MPTRTDYVRRVRIHHVAFRTRDLARLRAFYTERLGFSVSREGAGSVWLEADGAIVMLETALPGEPGVAAGSNEIVVFAIGSAEREAWRVRLALGNVAIESETAYTLYFRDPDGRRLGLSHYPD